MTGKSLFRSLLILVLASAALGAGWWGLRHMPTHWWRGDIVAEVHGQTVTIADVEDGLRAYLWRRGREWGSFEAAAQTEVREAVVHNLLRQRLIRHMRTMESPQGVPESATEAEWQGWLKQFQADGERTLRMGWQEATDVEMQRRIRAAQADQAWVEKAVERSASPETEADSRHWHEAHAEQMRIPILHRASHIYLTAHDPDKADREQEIRAIHEKLVADGASFAELAMQYSEDDRTKNRGGDLGWFASDRMPQDFMKNVEAMNVRQTSAPIRTKLGWHILRLDARKPSRLPEFEEVRQEIAATLEAENREREAAKLLDNLLADHAGSVWRCDPGLLQKIEPAKVGNK